MNKARTLTWTTVIGVVALVAMESLKGILAHNLRVSEHTLVRVEIGAVVLIILIVLNVMFHFSAAQAEDSVHQVRAQLSSLRASTGKLSVLSSVELYRELVQAANSARHRIYTTYLGATPPFDSNLPEKQEYFKAVLRIAKQKKNIAIRRIIRLTAANLDWIETLLKEYDNLRNVSIAVYYQREDSLEPLSIQLFDEDKLLIVHAAGRPPGQPRDLMVSDLAVVPLFDDYYEVLWRRSTPILDRGRRISVDVREMLAEKGREEREDPK